MSDKMLKAQVKATMLRARLRQIRDDDSGEILPWVLLTLGLLGVVATVVAAITTWATTKSGDITSH
ncbi:hypothetical protein KGQ19_00670 [Catenulispora sp. NL8]|uniref:DUF2970 domain-containing protein n=1 Tax=Catenulispora pinistramenti TaxID=2705254 RepID=A0ABS5KGG6_9ACTN|nr:hypothetical protein [Catenulispora pinistramenti]MBS2545372.1 hypothetical protein [Catenulispora pinistramenti]